MKKILIISLIMTSAVSSAAIFQVNLNIQDHIDGNPGDGICDIPTGGFCTLRAAVMEANALPGPDIIILQGNATIRLTRTGANENGAVTGDLDITDSVAIGTFIEDIEDFPTVDANNLNDRAFHVLTNNNQLVQFLRFKIVSGSATSTGGAISIGPGNQVEVNQVWFEDNTADSGGAVYVAPTSTLDMIDSVLVGNAAVSQGGAMTSFGVTQIEKSSIYENLNFNSEFQEAIYVGYDVKLGNSRLTLRNSTLFDNDRSGIYGVADVSLRNTTIANHNQGYGVLVNPGSIVPELRIRNSVFSQNDEDCSHGVIDSNVNNWNISSNTSCLTGGTTNLIEDPKLSSLKVGASGWHRYYRPGFYSPVVDSAHPSAPGSGLGCEAEDQRNILRPQDGDHNGTSRCDRGAIELLEDIIFYDDFDIQYLD